MEFQQTNESLLGFNFNEIAQSYLRGSAKWEKFMAWVNIILLSIAIVCCFFGGPILSSFYSSRSYNSELTAVGGAFTFVFIFYGIIFGVILVPNFYRLMFANKCIKAIDNKDEELLTESLKKAMW